MSRRNRRGSLGVYNSYLPTPVASMTPASMALKKAHQRENDGVRPALPGPSSGFYGPGSRPLPPSYYRGRDMGSDWSREAATRTDSARGGAGMQRSLSGRDSHRRHDDTHALWHNRRGSMKMISQEQILSTLAVDTPASTQQSGIRRRGAQEAPAATWLQSTRSPVMAARYADSISKGMDQRMQGMLQNRRRVSDVRGAVQSKQPPPPSTPPPPGQPNVSPTGTGGIKLALSGLSGASDSESLCLDITQG